MPPLLPPVPNKKAAPPDGMSETYFLLRFNLVIPREGCASRTPSATTLEGSLSTSSPQEPFYAPHINLGKVCHWPSPLNQSHRVFYCPSHHAQQRQRHHRRPVHSRGAMHEYHGSVRFQRSQRKLHAPHKHFGGPRLEIVVHRIPTNRNSMRPRQ